MPGNQNNQSQEEFDSLLDDLLSDEAAPKEPTAVDTEPDENPLRELKALLLEMDWEISDEIMEAMLVQAENLKKTFHDSKVNVLFLQLLQAVGKYIKSQKANAHPDAVKLLSSIYTGLEIVSMAEGMTDAEKQKILKIEVDRFKALKAKVAERDNQRPPAGRPETVPPRSSGAGDAGLEEVIQNAMDVLRKDITDLIRTEFETLRTQLKSSKS